MPGKVHVRPYLQRRGGADPRGPRRHAGFAGRPVTTLADLNKEPRESDWQGVYRIRQEYRIGRYGHAGSHSHLIDVGIIVAELQEHKPGTLRVGQLFRSAPICNSQRGQHGAQPLMDPRLGLDDITCAKCRERLGI